MTFKIPSIFSRKLWEKTVYELAIPCAFTYKQKPSGYDLILASLTGVPAGKPTTGTSTGATTTFPATPGVTYAGRTGIIATARLESDPADVAHEIGITAIEKGTGFFTVTLEKEKVPPYAAGDIVRIENSLWPEYANKFRIGAYDAAKHQIKILANPAGWWQNDPPKTGDFVAYNGGQLTSAEHAGFNEQIYGIHRTSATTFEVYIKAGAKPLTIAPTDHFSISTAELKNYIGTFVAGAQTGAGRQPDCDTIVLQVPATATVPPFPPVASGTPPTTDKTMHEGLGLWKTVRTTVGPTATPGPVGGESPIQIGHTQAFIAFIDGVAITPTIALKTIHADGVLELVNPADLARIPAATKTIMLENSMLRPEWNFRTLNFGGKVYENPDYTQLPEIIVHPPTPQFMFKNNDDSGLLIASDPPVQDERSPMNPTWVEFSGHAGHYFQVQGLYWIDGQNVRVSLVPDPLLTSIGATETAKLESAKPVGLNHSGLTVLHTGVPPEPKLGIAVADSSEYILTAPTAGDFAGFVAQTAGNEWKNAQGIYVPHANQQFEPRPYFCLQSQSQAEIRHFDRTAAKSHGPWMPIKKINLTLTTRGIPNGVDVETVNPHGFHLGDKPDVFQIRGSIHYQYNTIWTPAYGASGVPSPTKFHFNVSSFSNVDLAGNDPLQVGDKFPTPVGEAIFESDPTHNDFRLDIIGWKRISDTELEVKCQQNAEDDSHGNAYPGISRIKGTKVNLSGAESRWFNGEFVVEKDGNEMGSFVVLLPANIPPKTTVDYFAGHSYWGSWGGFKREWTTRATVPASAVLCSILPKPIDIVPGPGVTPPAGGGTGTGTGGTGTGTGTGGPGTGTGGTGTGTPATGTTLSHDTMDALRIPYLDSTGTAWEFQTRCAVATVRAQDALLIGAYGVGAKWITLRECDFYFTPSQYDTILIESSDSEGRLIQENHTITTLQNVYQPGSGDLIGWRCMIQGGQFTAMVGPKPAASKP
jgi:hypothetical protein